MQCQAFIQAFEMCGWFFHRSLVKAIRNRQSSEKLKTSVSGDPSDQIQKFSNFNFADSMNLAEITYFNINTGLKFPKRGRSLQRKYVSVQFSQFF